MTEEDSQISNIADFASPDLQSVWIFPHSIFFPQNNIPMKPISFSIFFYVVVISCWGLQSRNVNGVDTIVQGQAVADGDNLVSSGQRFELGFFSPAGSTNRYLGIWCLRTPGTIVWVANREIPLSDSSGVLTISGPGSLTLVNAKKSIIWSSNSSGAAQTNMIAQLLDSGNLVLGSKEDLDAKRYVWQSFDSATDTLLPGMRHGMNLKTGQVWDLKSWKNESDPSVGEFIFRLENPGLPQFVLRQGTEKKFGSGPWNGQRFSGIQMLKQPAFIPTFVDNDVEMYYEFEMTTNSELSRITLDVSGSVHRYFLNEGDSHSHWTVMFTLPYDLCSEYGKCGPNGICFINMNPICECLEGFVPKSQRDWDLLNWASGCKRRIPLDCQKGDGFMRLRNVKLPDLVEFKLNKSMSTKECETECLNNCSCTAFANSNISNGGSGCLMWFGDLIDVREFIVDDSEQDIFLRLAASELLSLDESDGKKARTLFMILPISFGIILFGLSLILYSHRRKKVHAKIKQEAMSRYMNYMNGQHKEEIELPLFALSELVQATNDFSDDKKLGEGGYGPVYWGKLEEGQEIAVKRLSKRSEQGPDEFKNEAICIAKLQHRNLVKLLGCCIEGEEKILIYEYMPNKSLDYFIFDQRRSTSLDWPKRFHIILGIARGLLYLHQDSRLRVIHRDLKASNILLDADLNPKISDFGTARSFGGNETGSNTNRVVGTHGYMSPEYAGDGLFSVKSDVFSFGVLVLEIASGKRNKMFLHEGHHCNLLGIAWKLNRKGRALELVDSNLANSYCSSEMLRVIHVGLLCVQQCPEDRPDMSSVVLMLGNEGLLPEASQPGFFMERSIIVNAELTLTTMEGR